MGTESISREMLSEIGGSMFSTEDSRCSVTWSFSAPFLNLNAFFLFRI
jgi:hypothetical protein